MGTFNKSSIERFTKTHFFVGLKRAGGRWEKNKTFLSFPALDFSLILSPVGQFTKKETVSGFLVVMITKVAQMEPGSYSRDGNSTTSYCT